MLTFLNQFWKKSSTNWVYYQLLVYNITELLINNKAKLLFNKFGNCPQSLHLPWFHQFIRLSCGTWNKQIPNSIPNLLDQNLQWWGLSTLILKSSTGVSDEYVPLPFTDLFFWNKIENYYNWTFYERSHQKQSYS